MSGALLPVWRLQVADDGEPTPGAKLFSWLSGTSTPQALYADFNLVTPLSNPVIADATGTFPVMFMANVAYRIEVQRADGTSLLPQQDHIYDAFEVFAATAQTANTVFAGPASGSTAAPAFRALVQGDLPSDTQNVGACEGRLTLTAGVPVTTANVTAATAIFFTPYLGNRIALYDGSVWNLRSFTEKSIAVPGTTATVYDVFAFDNSGVVALELLAWSSGTARATALVIQDGVYVKSGALTRRYLGSFRTTAVSGQTEDSKTNRLVWNYAQRLPRAVGVIDGTDSWAYTTATFRQANNSAANQVAVVVGLAEDPIALDLLARASNSGTSALNAIVAIGEDSTTAGVTGCLIGSPNIGQAIAGYAGVTTAQFVGFPPVGYHFYAWLEQSSATGTTTWYGDGGGNTIQSGLAGLWRA